ncbi:anoctamin-2 [Xenopus laevis]|uniref:Anoctamin n=2 Tax=Xenopus laevis TaxID=8355 RepID=A0A1L8GR10_XENLA|nr:anoctamin-2 [Xenopus laevis]OCT86226.1 hypothetical protein XELAEV_18019918mg [Xenopus laevis]
MVIPTEMELVTSPFRRLRQDRNNSRLYTTNQPYPISTLASTSSSLISLCKMEAPVTDIPLAVNAAHNGHIQRNTGESCPPPKTNYLTVTQYLPEAFAQQGNMNGAFDSSSCPDAHIYSVVNNYVDGNQPIKHSGMHFGDGKRKVDYVLAYHYRHRSSNQNGSPGSLRPPAVIVSNGNSITPEEVGKTPQQSLPGDLHHQSNQKENIHNHQKHKNSDHPHSENGHQPHHPDGVVVVEINQHDALEEEKKIQREEFEQNLLEAGLELEKDPETKSQGLNFVRIHAPWPVLSREAEFLKIKVPTKKMYEVKQDTGILRKLWNKCTKILQPKVPQLSENTKMKHLSYPFSRDKMHLYNVKDKETFFDNATRSRIVYEILKRTSSVKAKYSMGITTLIANNVYDSAYPLHDGDYDHNKNETNDRMLLYREWARYGAFYKYQPIDLIRKYFGEKIGLYFAWLGLYTWLLIPASLVGIIVFLYGCATIDEDIPSQEMCDQQQAFIMCPLCDKACDYWKLSSACSTARASHLFDNPATVFFSVFMALWATLFLEYWKRLQMKLSYFWDLTGLEEEEEHPRPEYETKLLLKREKSKGNGKNENKKEKLTWRDRIPAYLVNFSAILFMIALTFSAVFGVIIYRITTAAALAVSTSEVTRLNARVTVTATAVLINLVVVLILDEIYGSVAKWLTEIEVPKTEKTFEERLILKAFLLKFVNSYASIFYVAFFKGRFVGRPGSYAYIFNDYRMEACAPGGCLIELCIQLSIIMLGKQLIQNNLFEIGIPKLKKLYRKFKDKRPEPGENNLNSSKEPQQWVHDYALEPFTGLTPEYMEMIIQFGFVTLFVASFPLAPLFALLNNIIEVRLDAKKFVTELRRPDAVRSRDIGIWYNILSGIGKFSVIINAFVISVTSDFIPRLVYQYMYSENGTMHGFLNHTLSYFNVSNLKPGTLPENSQLNVEICRYKDYREPPSSPNQYDFSKQYWTILAVRLAFVILFQNLVMFLSAVVDWLIPDIPKDISEQIKKEKTVLVNVFLKEEQKKLQLIENFLMHDKQRSHSENKGQRSRAASFGHFNRSQRGSLSSFSSRHTDV